MPGRWMCLADDAGGSTLGAADCEAVSSGLLAQPVAALTSLAFLGAAGWLAMRLPSAGRARQVAGGYAVLVGLVGIGSLAYHGPQVTGAEVLHDVSIALTLATAAAVPAYRAVRGQSPIAPGTSRYVRTAAATVAGGLAAYLLGRTEGPLCRPESLLQLHGLWHVLMAVALGAWGGALWGGRRTPPA